MKCDAPEALAQETLAWLERDWADKLDFVVWTGDNARHDWDKKRRQAIRRKRQEVLHTNQLAVDWMASAMKNIPVIPSLGNNDVWPHNQVQDADAMLPAYHYMWQSWIPANQKNTFLERGYYYVDVDPRLRVVALNTMLWFHKNKAVHSCKELGPPRAHLTWLENVLQDARASRQAVLLTGHVPPSPKDYRSSCFDAYVALTTRYADVICGQLFGHLNMDHFLLYSSQPQVQTSRNIGKYVGWLRNMYTSVADLDHGLADDNTPALAAVQVSPSVLPVYYPGIRIYKYDTDFQPRKALRSYAQYYANITRWEQDHKSDEPLEYEIEYTTDEYSLPDLSAESLYGMVKRMVQDDDSSLWNTYTRNMFVRTQNDTF